MASCVREKRTRDIDIGARTHEAGYGRGDEYPGGRLELRRARVEDDEEGARARKDPED